MYNKHKCAKIMFQAVVDNKIVIEFNTAKKRNEFAKMVNRSTNHSITFISQVCYPWNLENGSHNLKSPAQFAKMVHTTVEKVQRAIKNGYLDTEMFGAEKYIVDDNGTFRIKDGYYNFN